MPRNQAPALVAGGNILPRTFVKLSSSANSTALQAGENERTIGITGKSTYTPPGITGESTYHAISGQNLELHSIGDVCALDIGSGGCTAGDLLKASSTGTGIVAFHGENVGAIALQTKNSGEECLVQILPPAHNSAYELVTQTALTDTATVTAAQLLTKVLDGTPTGAATYTLPTAALLVAAMDNPQVGSSFKFCVNNKSGGANTITVAAGTGGTGDGTLTVAQNVIRDFQIIVTNVTASSEAYFVYGKG